MNTSAPAGISTRKIRKINRVRNDRGFISFSFTNQIRSDQENAIRSLCIPGLIIGKVNFEIQNDFQGQGIAPVTFEFKLFAMPDPQPLILIVDDEEQIALLASLFLQRAGFRTVKATSGRQALELWSSDVAVLLTDCAMPDIFGDQLAIRFLERNPALKVLFMSGNSVSSLETAIALEPGTNFIQKPFGSEELVQFVSQALMSAMEADNRPA